MKALLAWRDSGEVYIGSLVSERRCPLVRAHPQEMLVTLWSIFRRVKMVLSFRKSRVFSRTRFQLSPLIPGLGARLGFLPFATAALAQSLPTRCTSTKRTKVRHTPPAISLQRVPTHSLSNIHAHTQHETTHLSVRTVTTLYMRTHKTHAVLRFNPLEDVRPRGAARARRPVASCAARWLAL